MVECASNDGHTVQVFDSAGRDITRNEDGAPGMVHMLADGSGTQYCLVTVHGPKKGETIRFVVSKQADPMDRMEKAITLDQDCSAREDAAARMPVAAKSTPAPKPKAKAKVKAKPKAKPKAKAVAKKAKPKAKPMKKTAKATKAKPAKKKPAKKKPAAKKKRR